MKLKSIRSINLRNKRILLRVDFNVPIKRGRVVDDTRIRAALPTIEYLLKKKAKVILSSHFGRPLKVGRRYSLRPVYKYLANNYKLPITFVDDCIGKKVKDAIDKAKPCQVVLLENLRFYPGEEKNDLKFAKKLANLADLFVNDAFSVSHRKHASVVGVARFLPSYAGFLLEREIKVLSEVLTKPKHPLIVILGGVKISTKIGLIKNLSRRADKILIGGALANNFLAALGSRMGKSIYEKDMVGAAKKLLAGRLPIVLPADVREDKRSAILDIGPKTVKLFSDYIKKAKMIVWNGPMGLFEKRGFEAGTKGVIKAILANKKAKVIIGGGETIAALNALYPTPYTLRPNLFISTGGGAMLEFLAGEKLPGLKFRV